MRIVMVALSERPQAFRLLFPAVSGAPCRNPRRLPTTLVRACLISTDRRRCARNSPLLPTRLCSRDASDDDHNTNLIEDSGRGRRTEFRLRPAVLMECRPSDYNGRSCKDGCGGVGHIPRPTFEMLIPDPNRERNRKEKEDGTT